MTATTAQEASVAPGGHPGPLPGATDALGALLGALGVHADETVSVCHDHGGGFTSTRDRAATAPARARPFFGRANVWFGVNPVRKGATGRGTTEDVTRVVALWADLDVKPGGLADLEACQRVVDALAGILQAQPVAVVSSGHGLQPYWRLADGDPAEVAPLVRRWGRLVQKVAATHGGDADNVYDLARVLRVPGSVNVKDRAHPVPAELVHLDGDAETVTPDGLDDALLCHGVGVESFDAPQTSGSPLFSDPDGTRPNPHEGPIPAGGRDNVLRDYARLLRGKGLSLTEAKALMRVRWEQCEQPAGDPYPLANALTKVDSAYAKFEPNTPDSDAPPSADGHRTVTFTRASSIKVRPVHWLWKGRVALGTLALLAGREGIGKSTIGYTLAAQVTRGTLPGVYSGQPRQVVVAATEDSWEHTIVPRLMAAGADLDKVLRVDVTTAEGVDTSLSLPRDLDGLERLIRDEDVALVLLDPLMSRLAATLDSHKDAEVRLALEPLTKIADRTGSAFLGLIHVNKSGSTDPLNGIMGSRAFAAVARSVLYAMADPDDEELRHLGTPKNNLGSTDLPTLDYRIESVKVADTEEGPVWTGRVSWVGESAQSIRDLMQSVDEKTRADSATGQAEAWLRDFLGSDLGAGARAGEVKAAGRLAGHSEPSVVRASKRLRVESVPVPGAFPRQMTWHLPVAAPQMFAG